MFDDDDIKNQRAIIAAATPPGPFVKSERYDRRAIPIAGVEVRSDGALCNVLTEEDGAELYEAVPVEDADFVIAASTRWPAALDEIERLRRRVAELTFEAGIQAQPIPMLLWCPECGERHVDVGEFATRVHHTHSCQSCGLTWRPAIVPTCGVQFLPGFKNPEPEAPKVSCARPGCTAEFRRQGRIVEGWVFRLDIGWRCPEHAPEAG